MNMFKADVELLRNAANILRGVTHCPPHMVTALDNLATYIEKNVVK